MEQQILSCFQS